VRAGGHAAITHEGGGVDLLVGVDARGKITELGRWALLSIEIARWRRVKGGPAKGLATARLSPRYQGAVLDWCARDSMHEGPTRVLSLDCMDCAACCHDANVVLDEEDLGRWRDAGRADLTGRGYVRRARDGKVTLRFAATGRCQHLGDNLLCGIYALRPDNCRAFVIGSEACLAAREETLGLRDGAPAD
jgi:Fe-S-cluster containining protein